MTDAGVPIVITEGEKKALALWRAALASNGAVANRIGAAASTRTVGRERSVIIR